MKRLNAILLSAAVSVTAFAAGNNTLIDAARTKNTAAVTTLLSQKADAKAVETDGTSALHWAAH